MYSAQTAPNLGLTIDAIYDAAVVPSRIPHMLARLSTLFDAQFVDSYACTHDRMRRRGIVHGLDEADYQGLMLDTWARRNVWAKKAPVRVAGEVKSTRQMVPRAELLRSAMYNEFLEPRGLHEGMRIAVWADEVGIEDVSLLRPWSAGPFAAPDLALGHLLFPHLQRATLVRRRLQEADLQGKAGLAALATLHHAVLLLDTAGAVVFTNLVADVLLARADGLTLRTGQLLATTPALCAQLESALRRATGERAAASMIRLPRPSGGRPLSLVAMPLRWDGPWSQPGHPAVMLCISEPGVDALPFGETLMELFGLTSAEAALATDLLSGLELAQIAQRSERSLATIRTHLARLMAKTDTSRQSELLRLLLACPRAPTRPGV